MGLKLGGTRKIKMGRDGKGRSKKPEKRGTSVLDSLSGDVNPKNFLTGCPFEYGKGHCRSIQMKKGRNVACFTCPARLAAKLKKGSEMLQFLPGELEYSNSNESTTTTTLENIPMDFIGEERSESIQQ